MIFPAPHFQCWSISYWHGLHYWAQHWNRGWEGGIAFGYKDWGYVFRALLTGVGACTMLVIFGFDWKKKEKKKRNPGIRTHATLHTVFPRYTLSPVDHRGVLFQYEEEPFDISLLNLCDKTWSNVNKSSRFTVKIWWYFAHSLHF